MPQGSCDNYYLRFLFFKGSPTFIVNALPFDFQVYTRFLPDTKYLCEFLNETNSTFPVTNLKLIYEMVAP